MKRVLTALILIPAIVYIVQFAPAFVCIALIFLVMLLALQEYLSLVDVPVTFRIVSSLIAAIATLIHLWPQFSLVMLLGVVLLLTLALFPSLEMAAAFHAAISGFFGAIYVGGLMGFLIAIRIWNGGEDFLMMLLLIIWAGDSFAYFAGKSFGRHKLSPTVSPNKTWEGAVAGFVFGIAAAIICKFTFIPELELVNAIGLGAVVGIAGQIGDLCESIVKRAAKVKDSGGIIPGHGGMLDRVDSLLFGAPAMYYYLSFFS
ncbi:phosphatidate cytidylyltransferase [bacterium]|nr:phosphatidate cytidylyltransferase [bacterium]MCI0603836.1 phosphatidate cytidylyltransferase [bacterium]